MSKGLIRVLSCPWQKVIITEKQLGSYKSMLEYRTTTHVSFGECMTNCPFYDAIGNYCRRISKHD